MNGLIASFTICTVLLFCNLSGLMTKKNSDSTPGTKTPEYGESRSTDKPREKDKTDLKSDDTSDQPEKKDEELVSVSLRIITQGASGCGLYYDEPLKLKTQGRTFSTITNSKGVGTFKDVPCGSDGEITSNIELLSAGGTFRVKRNIDCSKSVNYWGSYGDINGSSVPEKEANYCR